MDLRKGRQAQAGESVRNEHCRSRPGLWIPVESGFCHRPAQECRGFAA